MEFTGGCVCGGTRYVLKSRPVALVDCHCIDCRRSAGAPYVQWGSVPRKDLVLTKGEPRKIRVRESDSFVCCVLRHAFVFRGQPKIRTRSMSRLRRSTIRRRLRRRKRSSSKINCPGLSSTNQSRRFRQSRRRSLTTDGRILDGDVNHGVRG